MQSLHTAVDSDTASLRTQVFIQFAARETLVHGLLVPCQDGASNLLSDKSGAC